MQLPKVKAVLYTSKKMSDGKHPIMIRITQNRKSIYKSVGHAVHEDAWDEENDRVYEKKPLISKKQEGQLNDNKLQELKFRYANAIVLHDAKHINSVIEDAITQLNSLHQKLKVNDESLDIKNIRKKLKPQETQNNHLSILSFGTIVQDRFKNSGRINTYKRYKSILDKLKKYKKQKDVLFSDIDLSFLEDYENYLHSQKYKINTIHNNLKTIRAIYYAAIKEGIITADKNPFFIFKLKQDTNTKKEKLTVEEILSIEKLDLEKGSLIWNVRNYFLFSFYCAGIRVSDLIQLKWENITSSGRVEYKMDKTGGFKSIGLLPKALAILEYYKKPKVKKSDFIFPLINTEVDLSKPDVLQNQISAKTALINKYLKIIGQQAEIDKPISTHIARHSFSDIARKRGANVYDISKMLGHSSIKITEAYLSSLDTDSQDETLKSVLDF